MTADDAMIPVELCGGILDGAQREVRTKEQPFDMYLFEVLAGGRRFVLGYRFASRTTRDGKRWILEFECVVAACTLDENEGKEAA